MPSEAFPGLKPVLGTLSPEGLLLTSALQGASRVAAEPALQRGGGQEPVLGCRLLGSALLPQGMLSQVDTEALQAH